MTLQIGFTGTRKGMTSEQEESLKTLLKSITYEKGMWVARHGDCHGADTQFHNIARSMGAFILIHPPQDNKLRAFLDGDHIERPKPYTQRNKDIVEKSDIIVAAPAEANNPGYGGTWQTIRT